MRTRLATVALSVVAAFAVGACSGTTPPAETSAAPNEALATDTPAAEEPTAAESTSQEFTGETQNETITVGPMEVTVPLGIKLPADSIVTQAEPSSVMMVDEDPQAIIDAVTSSAAEAGYQEYAKPNSDITVWVGNGNAVMLMAIPQAQILTWGPEAMADVLAGG